MADEPVDERRLQKEEARRAKAEAKAAAKAGKEAAKAERKARRKGGDTATTETTTTTEEPLAPIPVRPRLELVTAPGPVKRVHWDADATEPVVRTVPPRPAPTPPLREETTAEPAAPVPQVLGRRRTLYTTEHGNKVVAYESGGSRQLTITQERGGQVQEVPFDESQVDRLVGAPATETTDATAPLQETTTETPAEEPKRGFWRRRKEAPAATTTTGPTEHVYRPVDPVATLPKPAETHTQAQTVQTVHTVPAWEPSGALQQVHRAERPASVRPPTRRTTTRKTTPRRRAARKPARIYPGDNHPVIDIEGIGPTYAKKLEAMGITTTGLLNAAKPGRVAARLQVPRKTVKKWQAEAELIKVRGIGPQFAEALARSGVTGIDELKKRSAEDIARQVAKYLAGVDQTVVGQPVTAKRIARWKRKAAPMRRVNVSAEALATPTHGLPPPWLREKAGKTAKKATGTTRKATTRRSR